MGNNYLLKVEKISKAYPGTQALSNVDMDLCSGEIHATVGENGAGKSTLMNILAGITRMDSGKIILGGTEIEFETPEQSLHSGISMVHQELCLFPSLTVAENIYVGMLPKRKGDMISNSKLISDTQSIIDRFDIQAAPTTIVRDLGPGDRQLVEIGRALSRNARILILDEPTSSLSEHEADNLFKHLKRLREDGVAILYISHKLEEVFFLADRITVLRDGRKINTVKTSDTNPDDIVQMMVGRELEKPDTFEYKTGYHKVLKVSNLSKKPKFNNIDLTLTEGELLGIYGLVGAGRTEFAQILFGLDRPDSGDIYLDEKKIKISSPDNAISQGIAYLAEDRKDQGLFYRMSIAENIAAAKLADFTKGIFLDDMRTLRVADDYIKKLRIKTPDARTFIRSLSGGNQQKVLFAKWLATNPKVLIADEPTRGVDVGSKADIHHLLRELVSRGIGVIVISSDLPEILEISNRILVMREGRIAGDFMRNSTTQEELGACAAGHEKIDKESNNSTA